MKECPGCCNHHRHELLVKSILQVEGIKCENCVQTLEKELKDIKGIEHVDTDLSVGEVKVFYDDRAISLAQIKETVEDAGYKVK